MQTEPSSERIIALYDTLANAEAALHDLQAAGVPYPNIRMGAHSSEDLSGMAMTPPPDGHFWSLTIAGEQPEQALEVLHKYRPFALAHAQAPEGGRDEVDQGAKAWRHYQFEPAGTDQIGEASGTSGTTGVISSGAFATRNERQAPGDQQH